MLKRVCLAELAPKLFFYDSKNAYKQYYAHRYICEEL